MDGHIIGLVAVTMALGIPMAAMYTFYRVRKLRTDERMAALGPRSRRSDGARAFAGGAFAPVRHFADRWSRRLHDHLRADIAD